MAPFQDAQRVRARLVTVYLTECFRAETLHVCHRRGALKAARPTSKRAGQSGVFPWGLLKPPGVVRVRVWCLLMRNAGRASNYAE
jgi:hypothetical protein